MRLIHSTVLLPQTFISKEHEKQAYGQGTPGPITANPYSGSGKQSLSTRSTNPKWGFGTGKVRSWLCVLTQVVCARVRFVWRNLEQCI